MRLAYIRPDVIGLFLFVVIHFMVGYDLYLSNMPLLLSTLWFIFILFFFRGIYAKYINDTKNISVNINVVSFEFYSSVRAILIVGILLGLAKVTLVTVYGALNYSNIHGFREEIRTLIPPIISLPIDGLISAFYPILLILTMKNLNDNYKFTKKSYQLFIVIVLLYISTGSRSAVLYFVWMFVFIGFVLRAISIRNIIIIITVIPIVLGLVVYLRLVLGDNEGHLNWYKVMGIINQNEPIKSAFNIFVFQLHHIVERADIIFDKVPDLLDYQNGKSLFFTFYSMLPGEQVNPSILLHHDVFRVAVNQESGYPPTTISQLYLDYGYWGVIIGSLVYAKVLWMTYLKICNSTVSIHSIVTYGALLYVFAVSFYGALEIFRLVIIIFFISLIRVMATYINKRKIMQPT